MYNFSNFMRICHQNKNVVLVTKKADYNVVADKDIYPSFNERKIQSLVMVFPYVFMYYV